jgi:hypothetical protein
LEKELATGPLASSPRQPTAACPDPVLQYQPTNRARGHAAVPPPRRPPRTPGCMRAMAAAATVNCRVVVTCFAAAATCLLVAAPFLSSLASIAAPLLPPLRPPAALLLRHFEKLLPSSLRRPPPPRRAARSKPRPPPSASAMPRCGQCASESEPVCHHLPKLNTEIVLLSEPPAKILDGLRRPAPPAYSRPSVPSWRATHGESPTAPPSNQVFTQSATSPTRPLHRSRCRPIGFH